MNSSLHAHTDAHAHTMYMPGQTRTHTCSAFECVSHVHEFTLVIALTHTHAHRAHVRLKVRSVLYKHVGKRSRTGVCTHEARTHADVRAGLTTKPEHASACRGAGHVGVAHSHLLFICYVLPKRSFYTFPTLKTIPQRPFTHKHCTRKMNFQKRMKDQQQQQEQEL